MRYTILVKYFHEDTPILEKVKIGDWVDLRADETITLKQGEATLIPLGVAMKLPSDYEAHLLPRSSTFMKYGVIQTNGMGIIDESYCGNNDEWKMPVLAVRDTVIQRGDRICQFRIMPKMQNIYFEGVTFLADTSRGGFGSTGVR